MGKRAHIWKQIPKGTPLASNIFLYLFFYKTPKYKFFCFQESADDTVLDQTHLVQILSLSLSDLEATLS